jgi:hypothetical protein
VSRRLAVPVSGALGKGTFAGTLHVQRFTPQDGGLAAVGIVTGIMTTSTGTTSLARTVRLPALVTATTDHAVQLDLGPVSVDVLWWRVDFGRIVLDVKAENDELAVELLRRELGTVDGEPARLARVLNGLLNLSR